MILCVTLNPCLDKTLTVPAWHPGDNVRGTAVREVVGGKGNNVARALKRLGRASRPVTFLGGPIGQTCEQRLRRDDGLDPLAIATEAPTRVILTVRTATDDQTAFFDPDPDIRDEEAEALHRGVERALSDGGVELLTLSGSSPSPATHQLYSDLIAMARSRKVPVLLDTYGPALDAVWGFWPEILKLNRREAACALGDSSLPTDDAIFGLLRDWARHGVQVGVVTDGPHAILVHARGTRYRIVPPRIEVVNPIGSGDCLLAGLADGLLAGLETEALLRRGVACAVANALTWDAGDIDPEEIRRLEDEIDVVSLGAAPDGSGPAMLVRKTLGRKR
jgi:1-phosphofructokinase family hexose kinase